VRSTREGDYSAYLAAKGVIANTKGILNLGRVTRDTLAHAVKSDLGGRGGGRKPNRLVAADCPLRSEDETGKMEE
jgi:hypothetical protein